MRNMQHKSKKRYPQFFLLFFVFLFSFYFLYGYRHYLQGPVLEDINVQKWMTLKKQSFLLKGNIKNTRALFLNGRSIRFNPDGAFQERIVLSPGDNLISLLLQDRLGQEKKYTYHLFSQGDKNVKMYPRTLREARQRKDEQEQKESDSEKQKDF